jgi:hypothetical protein
MNDNRSPDERAQQRWLEDIRESRCPHCGLQDLVAGPIGGASRNLYCPHCVIGWNVHAVNFGCIGVQSLGPIDETLILFARRRYPDEQPWRMPERH